MKTYPRENKTTLSNFWKGVLQTIGVTKESPLIAGYRASASLNFPSTNAQSSQDLTIACTGAKIGNQVIVGAPAAPLAGCSYFGYVAADDVVTVRHINASSSAKDPDAGTFTVTAIPNVEVLP